VKILTMQLKALTLLAAIALTLSAMPAAAAAEPTSDDAPVDFHQWRGHDLRAGHAEGLRPGPHGTLVIGRPAGTVEHTEPDLGTTRTYEYGRWTSPSYRQGFDATQLVASWNATTPDDTWLQVEMQGRTAGGATTIWYTMGRWALGDQDVVRTSVPDQEDANGYVDVDTFVAETGISSYQLRVTLYRAAGTRATPALAMLGAMTSAVPDRFTVPTSPPAGAWGKELPVPPYSQNIHEGQYPQYGGGGEAWCSPTSTAMVVSYWRHDPSRSDMSWVDPSYADPQVDHAARNVYDYNYDGAGNWPFNTAYAATFGLESFVTRLRSLTEAEQFIRAGIPLVVSVSFKKEELDGAGYGTNGHLMVIVGFDEDGNVVVNDPASHLVKSNETVRTTYDREQFENTWIPHSGGIAYVIRPAGHALPDRTAEPNW
jgi:hypothetical protein